MSSGKNKGNKRAKVSVSNDDGDNDGPGSAGSAGAAGAAGAAGPVWQPPQIPGPLPSSFRNKEKREEVHRQREKAKSELKRARRTKQKQLVAELGDKAPKPPPQRTIENTREFDETVVDPDDKEVAEDQQCDELAAYDSGRIPKICVTTSNKPVGETFRFAEELINIIPNADFYPRKGFGLKEIVAEAIEKEFTDIVVVNEDGKVPTGLWVIHLPSGPTAHFKLSSVQYPNDIKGHGKATMHYPEVILNNFHTRLGQQVGRMLRSLFYQHPEFQGRCAVTFHNQRDFIFFRRHRYIFRSKEKVGLQELGPRFTLKLRSLQHGTFDSIFGEYEWVHKRREMDTSRTRFFL